MRGPEIGRGLEHRAIDRQRLVDIAVEILQRRCFGDQAKRVVGVELESSLVGPALLGDQLRPRHAELARQAQRHQISMAGMCIRKIGLD